jgi:SAM-dependent methyltransferase
MWLKGLPKIVYVLFQLPAYAGENSRLLRKNGPTLKDRRLVKSMERISLDELKMSSLTGTEQEVEFVVDVLQLPKTSSILDLYCGYGRHTIELAKLGFHVTGLDTNASLLDIARQKASEAGVDIIFEQCDMRQLSYEQEFDAVINMFAAFGFFSDEENEMVIAQIHTSLRPGGYFLIDLLNREWMLNNNLTRYWRHPSGDYVLAYKVELVEGIAVMRRELVNQVTGTKAKYEFTLRAYSLPELTEIFRRHGFTIEAEYGGFDRRPYNKEAPRMIILARKK